MTGPPHRRRTDRGEGMADPLRTLGIEPEADEYGPRPAARWTQPWSSQAVTAVTVAGALVVGFLLTAGIAASRSEAEVQDARKQELVSVIRLRQAHVEELGRELEDLRARVADVEAEAGAGASALQRSVGRVEEAAGLRGLRGPGLRVVMDDARSSCRSQQPEDCRIQDTDVQLAVNALFSAGAEGVAVSGERVIATTAIRGAGAAVLVNYRVLAAPYELEAIGDPGALLGRFGDSELARDFAVWTDVFGLDFEVEAADELELPPYGGGLRLEHAEAVVEQETGEDLP